jgi:hypothetical protein
VVGALVVAGGDGAELLETAEEALDAVALLVDVAVVRHGDPAASGGRNDDVDAGLAQGLGEMVGVVGAVGDQAVELAAVQ